MSRLEELKNKKEMDGLLEEEENELNELVQKAGVSPKKESKSKKK